MEIGNSVGGLRLPTVSIATAATVTPAPNAGARENDSVYGGVGTLAAYGLEGDVFRFYEIDPAVVRIARDEGYFDFLRQSRATVEVVLGDARRSLAREHEEGVEQNFDILVVDAFSSDAIPIHLLTSEVFTHYADAMTEGGLLAVHVSNRHFELGLMVARHGLDSGMVSVRAKSVHAPLYQSGNAKWVLMSRDANRIAKFTEFVPRHYRAMGIDRAAIQMARPSREHLQHIRAWTDDFSDLLSLLKPLRFDSQR